MVHNPPYVMQNPILKTLRQNVHDHDMSEIILVVGRLGVGKSGTCLFIADSIDVTQTQENAYGWKPRFKLENCSHFVQDFVANVTKQNEAGQGKSPKGTCFILDEANVEHSNTDWYDLKAKVMGMALQTNRKYNYVILMTSPEYASLAIQTKRRITMLIELLKKTKLKGKPYVWAKVKWLDRDYYKGKIYPKYHRYWRPVIVSRDKWGKPVIAYRRKRVTRCLIPHARMSLYKPYDTKKDIALKEWYKRANADMEYAQKYLGLASKEKGQRKVSELKQLFGKYDPDTKKWSIEWDEVSSDGRLWPDLVEDILGRCEEPVRTTDANAIKSWLRREFRKKKDREAKQKKKKEKNES